MPSVRGAARHIRRAGADVRNVRSAAPRAFLPLLRWRLHLAAGLSGHVCRALPLLLVPGLCGQGTCCRATVLPRVALGSHTRRSHRSCRCGWAWTRRMWACWCPSSTLWAWAWRRPCACCLRWPAPLCWAWCCWALATAMLAWPCLAVRPRLLLTSALALTACLLPAMVLLLRAACDCRAAGGAGRALHAVLRCGRGRHAARPRRAHHGCVQPPHRPLVRHLRRALRR